MKQSALINEISINKKSPLHQGGDIVPLVNVRDAREVRSYLSELHV